MVLKSYAGGMIHTGLGRNHAFQQTPFGTHQLKCRSEKCRCPMIFPFPLMKAPMMLWVFFHAQPLPPHPVPTPFEVSWEIVRTYLESNRYHSAADFGIACRVKRTPTFPVGANLANRKLSRLRICPFPVFQALASDQANVAKVSHRHHE